MIVELFYLSDLWFLFHSADKIRLVASNSVNSRAGRVEVYHDGEWGTICDDHPSAIALGNYRGHPNNNMADVVCRMFGSDSGVVKNAAYFGEGTGKIWLQQVHCTGSESSLFDCQHDRWGHEICGHHEDVGVICDAGK